MQAVKGVEIGFAEEGAASFGSKVQDTIHYDKEERRFFRGDNRAGGIEGGMTNGQDIRVRGLLKPISTLRRPLESVDLDTRDPALAAYERSRCLRGAGRRSDRRSDGGDRAGQAFLEKFGGDSLGETQRNYEGYLAAGEELLARWFITIVKYGDPVLEREGDNVTEFDTPELHQVRRGHVRNHVCG